MPFVVRCKLCGTDHPYAKYSEGANCEGCGEDANGKGQKLNPDNVRVIVKPRQSGQADPLEGM